MNPCLLCEKETEQSSWRVFFGAKPPLLCPDCLASLEKLAGPSCRVCDRPMAEAGLCRDCAGWRPTIFQSNQSVYKYNEAMQRLIARFKYRGDWALAAIFAEDVRRAAKRAGCELICAVPMAPSRLAERRFNQSEALIRCAGLQPVPLLGRYETEKQSKKTRTERMAAGQTFYPAGRADGKSVLVVDDLYTTGATIRLVADALEEAGASAVKSMTIVRSGS